MNHLFTTLITLAAALPLCASEDSRSPKAERLATLPPAAVQAYDYDPERLELELTLIDGRRFRLFGVPDLAYEEFNRATDKAACYNRHLQPHYPGRVAPPRKPVARRRDTQHAGQCTRAMYLRNYVR